MIEKCPVCGEPVKIKVAQLAQFEKEICALFPKDEFGLFISDPDLEFFVHLSGALGCSFRGELIPCEAASWEQSLVIIFDHVKRRVRSFGAETEREREDELHL